MPPLLSGACEWLIWRSRSGGISDTSSEEEEEPAPVPPPHPICLTLDQDAVALAAWDLLSRPDGCSIRRLRSRFEKKHGPAPHDWQSRVCGHPYFEVFLPHRLPLETPSGTVLGEIFTDARRHPNAVVVPCMRPHPLGNPWPITDEQSREHVVELCADLMLYGGRAVDWGGHVHPSYRSPEVDARRESELERLARLVLGGASLDLRCCSSCEQARRRDLTVPCHILGVAAAIAARAQQAVAPPVPPSSYATSAYSRSRLAASAPQPARRRWASDSLHIRRAYPPLELGVVQEGVGGPQRVEASPRLVAALAGFRMDSLRSESPSGARAASSAAAAVAEAQPLAFAGAVDPQVAWREPAAPFSHRRLDALPDAECILMPFPEGNVPPVLPVEDPPPLDPPDLVAFSVTEVVPHNCLRSFKSWARRTDRSIELARKGHLQAAKAAKPPDLRLEGVMPAFQGVAMDFTSYPFRPLLPSRWPDRPPSTDLSIRSIRREFRSHPDYPDRRLRGALSHGNPAVGECEPVSYFAAPHTSVYRHVKPWLRQVEAERDRGWARANFSRSFGLASWPQRVQPTSMVERRGNWRLCHDLSWPKPGGSVQSPNDADEFVMIIIFVVVGHLAFAIMIWKSAGLPCKVSKFDLSKAYKRTGQQNATMWYRTFWSDLGSQTLDRICFGQRDGPCSFSGQTTWMVFVMKRELEYADACYPPRDPAVLAFVRFRLLVAQSLGLGPRFASLHFLMAMIDDFGLGSVDDLLYRVDGSKVLLADGSQRRRPFLHFDVCTSVVARVGHRLEPDDPAKYAVAADVMVLLGVELDVPRAVLSLESGDEHSKRARYLRELDARLSAGVISTTDLTSLAFKMLVVCECYPYGRQWLHPIFRALRGGRTAPVDLAVESSVCATLRRFQQLLRSDDPLSVPMASRQTFPYSDAEDLIVDFADASGQDPPWRVPFVDEPSNEPGYGAWSVHGRTLYYLWGRWHPEELECLSISVLEYLISLWASVLFSRARPSATHLLEFTDNSGAEWSMRRETPSAALMQRVADRRAAFLHEHHLFSRVHRVSSSANRWADMLSRQRVAEVLLEARELGLRCVLLDVPPDLRDTAWLTSAVP